MPISFLPFHSGLRWNHFLCCDFYCQAGNRLASVGRLLPLYVRKICWLLVISLSWMHLPRFWIYMQMDLDNWSEEMLTKLGTNSAKCFRILFCNMISMSTIAALWSQCGSIMSVGPFVDSINSTHWSREVLICVSFPSPILDAGWVGREVGWYDNYHSGSFISLYNLMRHFFFVGKPTRIPSISVLDYIITMCFCSIVKTI